MLTTSSAPPAACVGDRPGRAPGVLADRHADPHAADLDAAATCRCPGRSSAARRTRRSWAAGACGRRRHLAVGAHRGRVVEVAAGVDEADHRGAAAAARAATRSSAALVVGDEAGLEQQVLGRVPGDGQLGEAPPGRTPAPRPRSSAGEDAVDVAVEVADDGVDLAQRRRAGGPRASALRDVAVRGLRRRARAARRRGGAARRPASSARPIAGCADRRAARSTALGRASALTRVDRLDERRGRSAARASWPPWPAPAAALTRLLETDARRRSTCSPTSTEPAPTAPDAGDGPTSSSGWKRLEHLRIAARDLLGLDDARDDRRRALPPGRRRARRPRSAWPAADGDLAVIGMGKLGGRELNYASDIDVMFVEGDARRAPGAVLRRRPPLLPGRRQPPARGPRRRRSTGRSTATRRTGTGGPSRGSSRRCSRPGPSPATPSVGRAWADGRVARALGPARSAPTTCARCGR